MGGFNVYSALIQGSTPSQAFYISSTEAIGAHVSTGDDPKEKIKFDASRSSSVYGSSQRVQPKSTQFLIIIKA